MNLCVSFAGIFKKLNWVNAKFGSYPLAEFIRVLSSQGYIISLKAVVTSMSA